jgi:hypothetical protein
LFKIGDRVRFKDSEKDVFYIVAGHFKMGKAYTIVEIKDRNVGLNSDNPEKVDGNPWYPAMSRLEIVNDYGCKHSCIDCSGKCGLWEAE